MHKFYIHHRVYTSLNIVLQDVYIHSTIYTNPNTASLIAAPAFHLAGPRDRASEVRSACATAIGIIARETGNTRVIDHLIELFNDSDWVVRSSALAVCAPARNKTQRHGSVCIETVEGARLICDLASFLLHIVRCEC